MRVDPANEAQRLLTQVDPADLLRLAADPASVVEELFDVTVTLRPPRPPGKGCAVDGIYHPRPKPRITIANDVPRTRQRFTILHELGHHFIEHDDHLNDLDVEDADRHDEQICNEVAAAVLLPADIVEQTLPAGAFTAKDVADLYDATHASRMACCVAATRRMRTYGGVVLGTHDGTATFTAHKPGTPWRIARDTPQGEDSMLCRAANRPTRQVRGRTRVRFASGNLSGPVFGDAFAADDGWVYMVIAATTHSPWEKGLNVGLAYTGPDPQDIECGACGEVSRVWRGPCRACGVPTCPNCNRCACHIGPATVTCSNCFLQKPTNQFPPGLIVCVDCT